MNLSTIDPIQFLEIINCIIKESYTEGVGWFNKKETPLEIELNEALESLPLGAKRLVLEWGVRDPSWFYGFLVALGIVAQIKIDQQLKDLEKSVK